MPNSQSLAAGDSFAVVEPVQQCARGALRVLYLALAALFFALAIVGVVLPGLPTTPFLLLTAFFLSRASPRLHAALLANRHVGPMLRTWRERRAVTPRVKRRARLMILAAMALMAWTLSSTPWLLAAMLLLSGSGLLVVQRLPETTAAVAADVSAVKSGRGKPVQPRFSGSRKECV